MGSFTNKILVGAVIAVFLSSAFLILLDSDESSADTPITVTDSTGATLTLDGPANKVATLGYGFTLSVIELGGKDKIVAYDLYSKDVVNEHGIVGENIGSAYPTAANIENIEASMIQLSSKGNFDKSTDVVIINNYFGTLADDGTKSKLESHGFKVLCFGANTYDEVVTIVESIAKVIGKESSDNAIKMNAARDNAYNAGKDIADGDKVTAMYVNDYSGTLRIYNSGIATSMIELAGGKNIGFNGNTSVNYYSAEASTILQLNPDVIFLDGNHPLTAKGFQDNVLRTNAIKVIKMEKDWNNYCPSASDGLLVVSAAMLDDYEDDNLSWGGISFPLSATGLVATVSITLAVLLGLFVMRFE
ncbi:MAG TPA: ABC transporter substrate-binding protein [Candidatus Methanomethylophilaceae archaeon]|nr:ABC transporter substrate-binding protein [Candidatus Methanomethylophilaceae archaeon]